MAPHLVAPASPVPKHVALVGLGPSAEEYMDLAKRLGGRRALADETWAINGLGDVLACDRIFHMDDVRIQEIRAAASPGSNIAAMLAWMKTHRGPIYTSRAHPDYPGLVEFPLEAVLNGGCGAAYFNSTAAYAVALAIHLGVERISLFGVDFTYANSHHAEKGRACVEFWLGVAFARGVEVISAEKSSILDTCEAEKLYGYGRMGTLDVGLKMVDGRAEVSFTKRRHLPSAAAIEAAYDHSRHPSPLISGDAA